MDCLVFLQKGAKDMPWYGSHSYLNEYISEKKCKRILEIGVYNGENAKSMVETAIQNVPPQEVEYYGFDFFSYHSSDLVGRKLGKTGCKWMVENIPREEFQVKIFHAPSEGSVALIMKKTS